MFIYPLLAYSVLNSSQISNLKWELKYTLDPRGVLLLEDDDGRLMNMSTQLIVARVSFTWRSK